MEKKVNNHIEKRNLPAITADLTFSNYINTVKRYPTLSQEEEYILAKRVQEYHDIEAAQKLVTSHLKLVAKMAYKMRGYGVALMDLVAEGNIGLMHAVKKFDPDLGHRLSTYAMWWIKAAMQEFIIKSWSLVKIGTTTAQKKLFFNLNKAKKKILRLSAGDAQDIDDTNIEKVAKELNVTVQEVKEMNKRLSGGDLSLDEPLHGDDDQSATTALELLPEIRSDQEEVYIEKEELLKKKKIFTESLKQLKNREKEILYERHLLEEPKTLEELSKKYNISRERVRQIEAKAIEKIKNFVSSNKK